MQKQNTEYTNATNATGRLLKVKAKNKADSEDNILLKTLFDYIVPFLNKKYISADLEEIKDGGNLEGKLQNKNIEFDEVLFLEQLILSNIKKSNKEIKIKKQIEPKELDFPDFLINNDGNNWIDEALKSKEIKYSLGITNKKGGSEEKGYSVSIRYEETDSEEKPEVSVKINEYGLDKLNPLNRINNEKLKDNQKNQYSFSLIKKKEAQGKGNYSVKIAYDDNYEEERLAISYKATIGAYLNKRQESLHDFTDRVPGKFVNIFPESVMGCVLGFTYLGENFMGLRADLTGGLKKMVDIHESIHTPDEYETRILTDWIMSREKARNIR